MLVILTGGPWRFTVYTFSSSSVSDDVLISAFQSQEQFASDVIAHRSYATEDGGRVYGRVFDLTRSPFTIGRRMAMVRVQRMYPNLVVREYTYNDRFDSPELAVGPPSLVGASETIKNAAQMVFEYLKLEFLRGTAGAHSPSRVRHPLELASDWTVEACAEVVNLLLALFYSAQHGAAYLSFQLELSNRGFTRDWQASKQLHLAGFALDALAHRPIDREIETWIAIAESVQEKNWGDDLPSFGAIGSRTHLERQCPQSSKHIGDPCFWVLHPVRDRILAYASDPEISLDEFLDLAALLPPPGFAVSRRLSHASAFKVVYRASDPDGMLVALKRYKTRESEANVQSVLQQLGFTWDDVLRKDAAPHWMGRLRHTNILPCLVARNAAGENFIVEPLLDTTLERTRPSFTELRRWAIDICGAVSFLKEQRWIHGDLKPDNVGVQDGRAVLLDFGLASQQADAPRLRNNPGSMKTRAPELFSDTAIPSFASDVWAVGATLMGVASGGSYPLLDKSEIDALPPAGDPRRRSLEAVIRRRIEQYHAEPELLAKRIEGLIPFGYRPATEWIVAACQMEPELRPSASELRRMLRSSGPPYLNAT